MRNCLSCRNNPNGVFKPDGIDDVENGLINLSDSGPAIFAVVLAPVVDLEPPSIEKDSCGILERNAVLMQIVRRFGRIPFEIHRHIVESFCSYIKFCDSKANGAAQDKRSVNSPGLQFILKQLR
jgi:hypothetical protein